MSGHNVILDVQNLQTYFPIQGGVVRKTVGYVHAVEDVSFQIREQETFGLVGESGCGKSTTGRTILRLIEPTSGHIYFDGQDLCALDKESMRQKRRDMQLVFQDPYASLNPRMTVRKLLEEPLKTHFSLSQAGMLMGLQKDLKLSYLFISHDLNVVRHISNRVGVMYLGRIMELGDTEDVYHTPMHPYTQALLSAIPKRDPSEEKARIRLEGDVPSPASPPPGCAFHNRCPHCTAACKEQVPESRELSPGHWVACHLYD